MDPSQKVCGEDASVCGNVYTIVAFIAAGIDSHSALRTPVDVLLLHVAQYLLYMDYCYVFYHLYLYGTGACNFMLNGNAFLVRGTHFTIDRFFVWVRHDIT